MKFFISNKSILNEGEFWWGCVCVWLIDTDGRSPAPASLGAELLSRRGGRTRAPLSTEFLFAPWSCASSAASPHSYAKPRALSSWQPHLIQGQWVPLITVILSSSFQAATRSARFSALADGIDVSPAHLTSKTLQQPRTDTPQQTTLPVQQVHKRREEDYSQRVFSWLSSLPCPPACLLSRPYAADSGQRTRPFAAAEDTETRRNPLRFPSHSFL